MTKRIEIARQGGKLIWLAEGHAEYNTDVSVEEGCQAIVLCDGAIVDNLYGGVKKINVKSLFGKADGERWSVYGINASEDIELPWGDQIKYNDKEYGVVAVLKLSGEAVAKIENGGKLFRAIDCAAQGGITEEGLAELLRRKLIDEAERCVAQAIAASEGGVMSDIRDKIASGMRAALMKTLGDAYGLGIVEVRVRINGYDQNMERLWALKREAAEAKLRKEISESAGAGIRAIAEGVTAFGDKSAADADSINSKFLRR